MKSYNQTNFFKHTFCDFQQVDDFQFPKNTNYKSKSDSVYFYTHEGVYRKSNHWGRVANCRWKLISTKNYKNQQMVIGFARWSDFYPLNSDEKQFYISVDFELKMVSLHHHQNTKSNFLFHLSEAQKRVKQIKVLLLEEKWASYFNSDIAELRLQIISEYINLDKTLHEIKRNFK